MGSGWSEVQVAQPQQQPAMSNDSATRSDEHNNSNLSNSLMQGKKVERGKLEAEVKLAHGLEAILKDADLVVDRSPPPLDELYDQLYAGIFLNNRTKKYWIDKKSNSNCFMLFPRALSIDWEEDSRYWKWKSLEELSNRIEIIELLEVCWLEIHGKIKTSVLSPGTYYEAAFVVMMKDSADGWDFPVTMTLTRPDGSKYKHKENFGEWPRRRWLEISVGDFVIHDLENGDEIDIGMYGYDGGLWKRGMLLKGVVIRPKASI